MSSFNTIYGYDGFTNDFNNSTYSFTKRTPESTVNFLTRCAGVCKAYGKSTSANKYLTGCDGFVTDGEVNSSNTYTTQPTTCWIKYNSSDKTIPGTETNSAVNSVPTPNRHIFYC